MKYISFSISACILLLCNISTSAEIRLSFLGRYETGIYNKSGTEIIDYDPVTKKIFSTNVALNKIDVIDVSDPSKPVLHSFIDLKEYGEKPTSVSIKGNIFAVAMDPRKKKSRGYAVFFNTNCKYISKLTVGYSPDMLKFTPDGRHLLVANEGKPGDDYKFDPEGSVSIIDIPEDMEKLSRKNVRTVDFRKFSKTNIDPKIRIFGPGASVAQDLEPEYITISDDSETAWIVLQENNAIARLDIKSGQIESIKALGFKDHSKQGNGFDASDSTEGIDIRPWPVFGMYQPDGIAAHEIDNRTYIVSANEGYARDLKKFNETVRVGDIKLDKAVFRDADDLRKKENLGRLKITRTMGMKNEKFEKLYTFGARSFSIWDENLNRVFDSGDDFERITAKNYPEYFNADIKSNKKKSRSDYKGPCPEGLAVGKIKDDHYAFIGLEQAGGIMAYNITDPAKPVFVQYVNTRNFNADPHSKDAGDISPEGILFIPAADSPNGKDLLITANEVSGTVTIFEIR